MIRVGIAPRLRGRMRPSAADRLDAALAEGKVS